MSVNGIETSIHEAVAQAVPSSEPIRVLLASEPSTVRDGLLRVLEALGHRCTCVATAEGCEVLLDCHDLVMTEFDAPADPTALVHGNSRLATPVVVAWSGSGSQAVALESIRRGAVDFLRLPESFHEVARVVESAIQQHAAERRRRARVHRLRGLCRDLHRAKHDGEHQLDRLCDELSVAYRDIDDQLDAVAMSTECRTLMRQELDVEDMLRTALEILLVRTGPTNAAIFLPDPDGAFSLGAFVNLDRPGEDVTGMLDRLAEAICPQVAGETIPVAFEDTDAFAAWAGVEAIPLEGARVVAASCRHAGECRAIIVLFRNRARPFEDTLPGTLDTLGPIFAEQLDRILRIHRRSRHAWPGVETEDQDVGDDLGFDELAA